MKKSLVAMLLLLSSRQIFACDYYEDKKVLDEIVETGAYKSNVSGKVCSKDKRLVIPIKKGKVEGLVKGYYESGALGGEINFKKGKVEGLVKGYYESGALQKEIKFKNGKPKGFAKEYYESGALKGEINFKNGKPKGLEKWYYESGKLNRETKYKNGKEKWTKYYDRFGNVEYERKQK